MQANRTMFSDFPDKQAAFQNTQFLFNDPQYSVTKLHVMDKQQPSSQREGEDSEVEKEGGDSSNLPTLVSDRGELQAITKRQFAPRVKGDIVQSKVRSHAYNNSYSHPINEQEAEQAQAEFHEYQQKQQSIHLSLQEKERL